MKYYLIDITYITDSRYRNIPHSLAEAKQIAINEVNRCNGEIVDIHSEYEVYEEPNSAFRTGCSYPHGNNRIVGNLTVIYTATKNNSSNDDEKSYIPSEISSFILKGEKK